MIGRYGVKVEYLIGTMIELPRAALTADEIATRGGVLLLRHQRPDPDHLRPFPRRCRQVPPLLCRERNSCPNDPFVALDQNGVGQLVKMGCEKGRATRPDIKLGICGEHGGEASCHLLPQIGLDYVSCSPFRVPIARLAAAQAVLLEEKAK